MDWNQFKEQSAKRNAELVARYQAGETKAQLARAYGITRERVGQIIARWEEKQKAGAK